MFTLGVTVNKTLNVDVVDFANSDRVAMPDMLRKRYIKDAISFQWIWRWRCKHSKIIDQSSKRILR